MSVGINELLKAKREGILRIAAKHGPRNVRVFGSVARGQADEKSACWTSSMPLRRF